MTDAAKESDFTGYRYLVDVVTRRQYAVQFQNGQPDPAILCVNEAGTPAVTSANATIFAFEDKREVALHSGGATISATLFQIRTGEGGKPLGLNLCKCEYVLTLQKRENSSDIELVYDATPQTQEELKSRFSPGYPAHFTVTLQGAGSYVTALGNNRYSVDSELIKRLAFPPQFQDGAAAARKAVKEEQARPAATYAKAGDETLIQTKRLSRDERLKSVFDFVARRVTEIYEGPDARTAMTGHSFADHDRDALEDAWARLVALGGKPTPVDEKKAPMLKKAAVSPA